MMKYLVRIMIKQTNFFRPISREVQKEIADEERARLAMQLNAYVKNLRSEDRKPFALAAEDQASTEDLSSFVKSRSLIREIDRRLTSCWRRSGLMGLRFL
jgi:hypothetical protein